MGKINQISTLLLKYYLLNKVMLKRLSVEGAWILLGQVLSVIGSLLSVRLLTEALSTTEYGKLSLAMSIPIFVGQLLMSPLGQGVQRYYAVALEKKEMFIYIKAVKNLLFHASLGVATIASIVLVVAYYLGYFSLLIVIGISFFLSLVESINSIFIGLQNAARQRLIASLHGSIAVWLKFLIALACIRIWGDNSASVLLGYSIAIVLVLFSQGFFLKKAIQETDFVQIGDVDWNKEIIFYSIPFSVWGLFYWAQTISDRWALETYMSHSEVGQYAVLYQLGYYPISMVTGLVMTLLAPIVFQKAGAATQVDNMHKANSIIWNVTVITLGVTLFGFVVSLASHNVIFYFFASKPYRAISYLQPYLALSGGLFAAGQTISLYFLSNLTPKAMLAPKIITALLGIVFNFVGVYYYGLRGAVLASILFSFIYFVWIIALYYASNKQVA